MWADVASTGEDTRAAASLAAAVQNRKLLWTPPAARLPSQNQGRSSKLSNNGSQFSREEAKKRWLSADTRRTQHQSPTVQLQTHLWSGAVTSHQHIPGSACLLLVGKPSSTQGGIDSLISPGPSMHGRALRRRLPTPAVAWLASRTALHLVLCGLLLNWLFHPQAFCSLCIALWTLAVGAMALCYKPRAGPAS